MAECPCFVPHFFTCALCKRLSSLKFSLSTSSAQLIHTFPLPPLRLVNRTNQQTTVPIRGTRQSPHQHPLSYLSPRLRELLDAQLPESPFPSSLTQSQSTVGDAGEGWNPFCGSADCIFVRTLPLISALRCLMIFFSRTRGFATSASALADGRKPHSRWRLRHKFTCFRHLVVIPWSLTLPQVILVSRS